MNNKQRRADYDVTNHIDVTSSEQVCEAVIEILSSVYKSLDYSNITRAYEDFNDLYDGNFEGYHACDTFYHDKQHSLDMSLALARLIEGYQQKNHKTINFDYCTITMITALFHDAGYIRKKGDENKNGAIYTKSHVGRSAEFIKAYLALLELDHYSLIAGNMVHYTGYEMKPEQIELPEPILHKLGHLLGTADLIAQMSDHCYLQKCRDRLYPEFVLGDIAETTDAEGNQKIIYASGNDLLIKTPSFYDKEINHRLNGLFSGVYRYAENHFGKKNYYTDTLEANLQTLNQLIENKQIDKLKNISMEPNSSVISQPLTATEIKSRYGKI